MRYYGANVKRNQAGVLMSILTGSELEFLTSLRTNWRRLYLSEVARLLKEYETCGDQLEASPSFRIGWQSLSAKPRP
jgi:hypothetical protein